MALRQLDLITILEVAVELRTACDKLTTLVLGDEKLQDYVDAEGIEDIENFILGLKESVSEDARKYPNSRNIMYLLGQL